MADDVFAERQKKVVAYWDNVAEAFQIFSQRQEEYGSTIDNHGVMGAVCELLGCAARLRELALVNKLPGSMLVGIMKLKSRMQLWML